jgi:hypothetical protein
MSRPFRDGLVLLGVLSALDLAALLLTDGEHPPIAVSVADTLIGAASLALVVGGWHRLERPVVLIALRLVSAATAVPAFFVAGVPGPARGAAAAVIVLTGVGVALVLSGAPRPVAVVSR